MKTISLYFGLLLFCGNNAFTQNEYPTAIGSDLQLDGGKIKLLKPNTTGGWVRGFIHSSA